VGPRAGVDGRKISSPPGFDPGPSSPWSVTIPTELPGPRVLLLLILLYIVGINFNINVSAYYDLNHNMLQKVNPN